MRFIGKKQATETEPPINSEYQKAIRTNKNGLPLGSGKRSKPKEPKQPGAFARGMRGEHLCITLRKLPGLEFEATEKWLPLNDATLIALGYRPVDGYTKKTTIGSTYIKFIGFEKYPCMRPALDKDGNEIEGKLEEIRSQETASSLADYLFSDSFKRALDAMRISKVNSISSPRGLLYIIIIAVGLIFGFMYFMGRA